MSHDFDRLVSMFESAHGVLQARAARSVDVALVARNWLFGCYLVEYEDAGAGRGELYGQALIDRLAAALSQRGLKGVSPTNLRKFRAFYQAYPGIQQTLSAESNPWPALGKIQQTLSVTPALPPQERRPGRADPAQGQQRVCLAVPALSAVERRAATEAHRLGRRGGEMSRSLRPNPVAAGEDIEEKRDKAAKTLKGFLRELGYE